ncbi:MAG: class I SAM-dependent methyltransferase [Anaerolineaceae bacterium]|nr:class I SAM-dependent methyltransferase [Anaerolineaceae bacterium]
MKNFIENSEYTLDPQTHIWARANYNGIPYSDGEDIEQRIATIIKQASDLSVLSTELRQHCTDWPSRYHLSGTRANILRPFVEVLSADVLEIGAGCGAITRYLGECGANVLALEGSPRRAAITRSRTRDLENVTVVAEKFDLFQCNHQFDVITLIGVLEYANLFTADENPTHAMLTRVRSLLKPGGKLILAIENQFGLKYFAGAPEDHLGQPMYGIEGRYSRNQPKTFGRKVLSDMLKQTGFAVAEFLAPFPDYKLPVSILTEKGIANQDFDAAALAWQSVRRDPQLPSYCNFSLELAWPDIFKNGLALDLANSFLVIATPKNQPFSDSHAESDVLAYHYSTERLLHYCKETRFELSADKNINVIYKRLGTDHQIGPIGDDPLIEFDCPEKDNYSNGKPMSWEFIQIVTRDGWTIEEVVEFIQRYISVLEQLLLKSGATLSLSSQKVPLPGKFFDLIPQNIIITADGSPIIIDTEWSLREDVELGQLLSRGLMMMMYSITKFGKNLTGRIFSRLEFIQSVLAAAGFAMTEKEFSHFIELEELVQAQVAGRPAHETLRWSPQCPLPMYNLTQALAQRDQQIIILYNSVSWRCTRFLRFIGQQAKRLVKLP